MPPKREATQVEEIFSILTTKKLKPNNFPPPDNVSYHITIDLHPKFKVFPETLRILLQRAYGRDLYSNQHALIANTPRVPHHQTYQILKGNRIRSKSLNFIRKLLSSNIPSLALANAALMEHLLSEKQPNLQKDVTFSLTAPQEGLKNPEFLELHSVRAGEVGWGVDEEGALSFYFTKVEGKCLADVVWYVCSEETKIEEEG